MAFYKRNQIEEAIARVVEPDAAKPTTALRTRIKRLLELDRGLPPADETTNARRYAFFSDESPGKGREIWFSGYEAFALVVALNLMRHGWPQAFAVTVLRRVRSELEAAYSTTLAHDPEWLFDQKEIARKARPGDFAFDNQDPFLLSIVSRPAAKEGDSEGVIACSVRRPPEAFKFAFAKQAPRTVWTSFDVVGLAHLISAALTRTKPQSRGRS